MCSIWGGELNGAGSRWWSAWASAFVLICLGLMIMVIDSFPVFNISGIFSTYMNMAVISKLYT